MNPNEILCQTTQSQDCQLGALSSTDRAVPELTPENASRLSLYCPCCGELLERNAESESWVAQVDAQIRSLAEALLKRDGMSPAVLPDTTARVAAVLRSHRLPGSAGWCQPPSEEQVARLRGELLSHGGVRAVGPDFEPDIGRVLTRGRRFSTEGLQTRKGKRSRCHHNVAKLYLQRRYRGARIATGYGLSADGVWRPHSWLVTDGKVVETTVPREVYHGYELTGDEAFVFVWLTWP